MSKWKLLILSFLLVLPAQLAAQAPVQPGQPQPKKGFLVPMCIYEGDTIPYVKLPTVYIFKPLKFKNKRQKKKYDRLVYDVKKVLPIAEEINSVVLESYEYLQTLPTKKERDQHIKRLEKGLMKQYKPRLKKLTYRQGKLLIKLIDRQSNQTSYELVKAFLGPLKAGFYQTFAALFGASLKKEYDAEGDDALTERVVILVSNHQI